MTAITKQEFATYMRLINTQRTSVIRHGYHWNGRMEWSYMKELQATDAIQKWNQCIQSPERMQFYDDVMQLPERDSNGDTIELNHFLIQCVRIPTIEIASPRKIMQIALNIGQLISEVELIGDQIDDHIKQLYNRFLELNMVDFHAYVE